MAFGPLPPLFDCDNFLRKPLLSDDPLEVDRWRAVDAFGIVFIVIFRTVFVDAALFNDERELRRLVRDPLRSTSNERVPGPLSRVRARRDVVRIGAMVLRVLDDGTFDGSARSDRLRAKLSRFRSNSDLTDDFNFVLSVADDDDDDVTLRRVGDTTLML